MTADPTVKYLREAATLARAASVNGDFCWISINPEEVTAMLAFDETGERRSSISRMCSWDELRDCHINPLTKRMRDMFAEASRERG